MAALAVNRDQIEEALALQAIFGQDFSLNTDIQLPDSLDVLPEASTSYCDESLAFQLTVHPELTGELHIQVAGQGNSQGFAVQHLPPLKLDVLLPGHYPESEPPAAALSAPWLGPRGAALLAAQLQQLWQDNAGAPIVYTWTDWLQQNALLHLDVQDTLVLGGECCSPAHVPAAAGSSIKAASVLDAGAAPTGGASEDLTLLALLQYDAAQRARLFQEGRWMCGICLEEVSGTACVHASSCDHFYCADCVSQHCRTLLAEGAVDQLRCPQPNCRAPLQKERVRGLLSEEEYARWEAVELEQGLAVRPLLSVSVSRDGGQGVGVSWVLNADSVIRVEDPMCFSHRGHPLFCSDTDESWVRDIKGMADVVPCPRCAAPCIDDPDGFAQCARCLFAFCSLCADAWHPGSQCMSPETKLELLRQRMAGNKQVGRELREKELELMSLTRIKDMSKQCPCCGMAIQRSEGCNKMHCSNCGSFFCYKCGAAIGGYEHFREGGCVLFDLAEIARWEAQFNDQIDAQFQRRMLEVENNAHMAQEGAKIGVCPRCKAANAKVLNNNHMRCWSCTSHFCYLCRSLLKKGEGGSHFKAGGCRQHTPD